jgi:hypothetical protein
MGDKNVDPLEGKNVWKMFYFDAVEYLKEEDVYTYNIRHILRKTKTIR